MSTGQIIASACWQHDYFGPSVAVCDPDELGPMHKLLVLWGGEDISPWLYDETPTRTSAPRIPSRRDSVEAALAKKARELGIPILGVCRGAQLVCALDGGKLYQHVSNHGHGHHPLTTEFGTVLSNSCHHQMMIPREVNKILASTTEILSPKKYREHEVVEGAPEPEIVFFPEWKCLGVQGHPEWAPKSSGFVKLIMQYMEKFLCS